MTGWFKVTAAATYSGVSVRTVRTWLKNGLRHSRPCGGGILISRTNLDDFLEQFSVEENIIDEIVEKVMTTM